MAAPMKRLMIFLRSPCIPKISSIEHLYKANFPNNRLYQTRAKRKGLARLQIGNRGRTAAVFAAGVSLVFIPDIYDSIRKRLPEKKKTLPVRPTPKLSKRVTSATDTTGLKLTLYQFVTCPFCCKVRAMLDYYGISYDVVEVNSVLKSEIKWSAYQKVPILVSESTGKDTEGYCQINDSSVITSVLSSFLLDRSRPVNNLLSCYPAIEEQNDRGKVTYEFPNKYFIMYGDMQKDDRTPQQRKEERQWRRWTDDVLVHILSPNVYRTPSEAIQAFQYFSDVGNWEKNFSTPMRLFIVYVGAAVMYLVSGRLKKRHNLKDDVRESLHDAADTWVKAIGKNRKFLGGDQPNLADLAVYGALNSIEGCTAFQDLKTNKKLCAWYYQTKEQCENHAGASRLQGDSIQQQLSW